MTPKIIQEPDNIYHSARGLNASALKKLAVSPAHCQYAKVEESAALLFGRAAHCLTLEPHTFGDRFSTLPTEIKQKRGKKYENFLEKNIGKEILTPSQEMKLRGMETTLFEHPIASKMLQDTGVAEMSLYWEEKNILCKGRIDKFNPKTSVLLDYKTTFCSSPDAFSRSAINLGYHLQAAHYIKAIQYCYAVDPAFIFIAQEKEEPYAVTVFECDEKFIEYGMQERTRLMNIYKECTSTNIWPAYPEEIHSLKLPWGLERELEIENSLLGEE